VPWHLTTREVISDVRRVLRPDGLYLMNVIDHGDAKFVKAEVKTAQAVFPYVAVIARKDELSDRGGGNFVVAAADRPIDSAAIERRLGPSLDVLDRPDGFVGDAPVLTDDYAPVDQLLTPYSG